MGLRTDKLASVLKRDLAPILQGYQRGNMITVTGVRLTDDLLTAKVYLSIYTPDGDTQRVFEFVKEQMPSIRNELAAKIRHQVRRIPELVFFIDDTAEYVSKIESLFRKIEQDRRSSG
jgi:ribosome-binding factor A